MRSCIMSWRRSRQEGPQLPSIMGVEINGPQRVWSFTGKQQSVQTVYHQLRMSHSSVIEHALRFEVCIRLNPSLSYIVNDGSPVVLLPDLLAYWLTSPHGPIQIQTDQKSRTLKPHPHQIRMASNQKCLFPKDQPLRCHMIQLPCGLT